MYLFEAEYVIFGECERFLLLKWLHKIAPAPENLKSTNQLSLLRRSATVP